MSGSSFHPSDIVRIYPSSPSRSPHKWHVCHNSSNHARNLEEETVKIRHTLGLREIGFGTGERIYIAERQGVPTAQYRVQFCRLSYGVEDSWRCKKRVFEGPASDTEGGCDTDARRCCIDLRCRSQHAECQARYASFPQPSPFLPLIGIHHTKHLLLHPCVHLNTPRRANVPSAETTSRSASSGSITRSRALAYSSTNHPRPRR